MTENIHSIATRPVFIQAKFRDGVPDERVACHITVDPRVAKGLVYTHYKKNPDAVQPIRYKPKPIRARQVPTDHQQTFQIDNDEESESEPEPELFEINDRPIEEDLATAPETFIERPPTPIMIEEEPGKNVETQVGEFDLFNFDQEVRPMVIVIVQHTLLRAIAEVHQEVEAENIAKHKDEFEVQRNTILAELQRYEAKAQRIFDERKAREEQRREVKKRIRQINREASAKGFSEFYANDIVLQAIDLLEADGFFYDEIEREVRNEFLPWVSFELKESLESKLQLYQFKKAAFEKAQEIAASHTSTFSEDHKESIAVNHQTEIHALRNMIIEDRAGETIRRALQAYQKSLDDKNNTGEEGTEETEDQSYDN